MTLKEILDYAPGMTCKCHAYGEYECGCDADWTSKQVYFLKWKLAKYDSLVNEWFLEYREKSVTKQTTAELNAFKAAIDEPITVGTSTEINPVFKPWLNEDVDLIKSI